MVSREAACALLLVVSLPGPDPPRFVDVRPGSGIDFVHASGDLDKRTIVSSVGGGVALFDYDQDSDLDVYLVRNGTNRLYRNLGAFRFVDVTEGAGLSLEAWSIGCAAADFDNDGLSDLYVVGVGGNVLYRNRGDGTFEDVTARFGVADGGFGASAAFLDADSDGDLDLYVARYVAPDQEFPEPGAEPTCIWLGMPVMCGPRGLEGDPDAFYRNDGARFVEAAEESGLLDTLPGYGLGVVSADLDGDGAPDLYVANDTHPNFLFRNDGKGRFEDVGLLSGAAYDGRGATQAGMGVDAGDANGDGVLDLFVSNFSHETNTLYLGSSGGVFTDATAEAGLATPSLGRLGWGARFVDVDNDGDEDLFVANGHVYPNVSDVDATTTYRQSNQVFLNDGRGSFLEAEGGADSEDGPKSYRGAAFGDLDDDGDVDVVVTAMDDQTTVLRNDFPRGARFLGLALKGRVSNREGAGTRIRLVSGGRAQVKEAHASGSIFSSNDPKLVFGLGPADSVEEIEVRWPSGAKTHLRSVPLDRYLVLVEGVEGWLELGGSSTSP